MLNALPEQVRYPLTRAFWYTYDNWRVGTATRAENAQWYRVTATTSSVANQEFSVRHRIGSAPTQIFPVLDLSQINAQLIPLQVSRPADATYLYLKSASTSAAFTVMVEV